MCLRTLLNERSKRPRLSDASSTCRPHQVGLCRISVSLADSFWVCYSMPSPALVLSLQQVAERTVPAQSCTALVGVATLLH